MRLHILSVAVLLSLVGCTSKAAVGNRSVPVATSVDLLQEANSEVTRFMDALKASRTPSLMFNVNDVPNWDPKAIANFVVPGGVIIEDVNTKVAKKFTPQEVERALFGKKGEVFKAFSHISFLYAKGKPQYSELTVTRKAGIVLAVLATWYELEFISVQGHLKLRRCKYINLDAD